jgi:hypothetical protein
MVLSTSSLHASAYRITNGGVPEITYILKPKWESQRVRRSEDLALHIMLRFAYSSFVCVLAHSNPVPSAASATAPTSPDFGSNSNTDDDDDTFDLCLPCSDCIVAFALALLRRRLDFTPGLTLHPGYQRIGLSGHGSLSLTSGFDAGGSLELARAGASPTTGNAPPCTRQQPRLRLPLSSSMAAFSATPPGLPSCGFGGFKRRALTLGKWSSVARAVLWQRLLHMHE